MQDLIGGRSVSAAPNPGIGTLFPEDLDHDPFFPLAVELRIIHLLPGPEIQLPRGDRQNHLVVHQQALQVGVSVGFPVR